MQARFKSRWANNLARIAISLVAAGLFFAIRPDITAYAARKVRLNYQRGVTGQLIDDYIRNHSVRKLQLGAGTSMAAGWLNTDIEPLEGQAYLDVTKPFPLPDSTFQYVFSEHVIEHFPYETGLDLLRETYRVLAPGGKVRVSTPNLDSLAALLSEPDEPRAAYVRSKLFVHDWPETADAGNFILNSVMREWGHQFVYSSKMLRGSLEKAGFKNVKQFTAGESGDPTLTGLELRIDTTYKDVNAYETMSLEAEK